MIVANKQHALSVVNDPKKIAEHNFHPFIELPKKYRKYGKYLKYLDNLKRIGLETCGDEGPFSEQYSKIRPIKYAAHKDVQIFSYYRHLISKKYEEEINNRKLNDNIVAYRKIPKDGNKGKCNIDFAKEAFDEIARRKNANVLAIDIENFFENLDHIHLKKQLEFLLGALSEDYLTVLKSLCDYSVVSHRELYQILGLIRNDGKRINLEKWNQIKKNKKRLCTPQEYRELVVGKGLVKKNKYSHGIPQGAPLSDVLANLYMIDFDSKMKKMEEKYGGYYRRYSDDILFIFPPDFSFDDILSEMKKLMEESSPNLRISDKKTTRTTFRLEQSQVCKGDPLNYLGFLFDGRKIFFSDNTISRYKGRALSKIKRLVRNTPCGEINRSFIFQETYLKNSKNQDGSKNRKMNFMDYVKRSLDVFNKEKSKYRLWDSQINGMKPWIHKKIDEYAAKKQRPKIKE